MDLNNIGANSPQQLRNPAEHPDALEWPNGSDVAEPMNVHGWRQRRKLVLIEEWPERDHVKLCSRGVDAVGDSPNDDWNPAALAEPPHHVRYANRPEAHRVVAVSQGPSLSYLERARVE